MIHKTREGGVPLKSSYFSAALYGWIVILLLILISSVIFALLIRFTSISEMYFSYATLLVGLITLFIGGMIAGMKAKSNGWFIGAITGVGFTFMTFLIQYLGYNEMFTSKQFIYHLTYILVAIFGSIIGVNVSQENR